MYQITKRDISLINFKIRIMTIKLNYSKANEINFNQFQELNNFDNFITDTSNNQVIMRMTEEQYQGALEALECGEDVNIVS